MGKDSRMCGCADVQMCGFNQHLNMGLVGKGYRGCIGCSSCIG